MTCPRCKIRMEELKGHVYHKNRKWRCPRCGRARMQKPRGRTAKKSGAGKAKD